MREDGQDSVVIYQQDHANLAAQFAAHWGNEMFSKPEPFDDMQLATRTHDDGWIYMDEKPLLSERGRPLGFVDFPSQDDPVIDKVTLEMASKRSTYVRLMVSMHRTGLMRGRYGLRKGWDLTFPRRHKVTLNRTRSQFVNREEKWQSECRKLHKRIEYDESHVWTNYKLLQLWDKLSLYLCFLGRRNPNEATFYPVPSKYYSKSEVTLSVEPKNATELCIEPWPFDSNPVKFGVRAFKIGETKYQDSKELVWKLNESPQSILNFVFTL